MKSLTVRMQTFTRGSVCKTCSHRLAYRAFYRNSIPRSMGPDRTTTGYAQSFAVLGARR